MHDESGCGHVPFVFPGLNVAEAGEPITLQSDHRLGFPDLLRQILRLPLRNAGTPDLRGLLDRVQNLIDINEVLLRSDLHSQFVVLRHLL